MSSRLRVPSESLAVIILLIAACLAPDRLPGQMIPIKTVPVAAGNQYLLFPSDNLAMGGLSLASADTMGGIFQNPSLGYRLPESFAFGSPTYYAIAEHTGSARSLPVGTIFRTGDWFGGGGLAIQELEGPARSGWRRWSWLSIQPPQPLSEGSTRNLYAFGVLGREFPRTGISVGLSGFWADLRAVDGVGLLYAQSENIRQSGTLTDLRLGVTKDWGEDRTLELLLLRSRHRMRHDVTYLDWLWTPGAPEEDIIGDWAMREEKNKDFTDTWGAHLAYHRSLAATGWRIGWSLTGNWKDHPKIPNYEIQNIPRDPGNSQAFRAGMGLSRVEGPFKAGVELYLEPIRSKTWADAATDTVSVDGRPIRAGERTVDNEFDFTNALVRVGGSWRYRKATVKAGLQVRSIAYELEQDDHVQAVRRTQEESWMEWTPSLGISLSLDQASLHYTVLVTTGTGRPAVDWNPPLGSVPLFDSANDFLLAPTGPLTLQDARVTTHQISLTIPIR